MTFTVNRAGGTSPIPFAPLIWPSEGGVKSHGAIARDLREAIHALPDGALKAALQRVCQDLGDITRPHGERAATLQEAQGLVKRSIGQGGRAVDALLKAVDEDFCRLQEVLARQHRWQQAGV